MFRMGMRVMVKLRVSIIRPYLCKVYKARFVRMQSLVAARLLECMHVCVCVCVCVGWVYG